MRPTRIIQTNLKCRIRLIAQTWTNRLFSKRTRMNRTQKFFRTSTWRVERWTQEMSSLILEKFRGTLLTLRTRLHQILPQNKLLRKRLRMWPKNQIRPLRLRRHPIRPHKTTQLMRQLNPSQGLHPMPWSLKRSRLAPPWRPLRSYQSMRKPKGNMKLRWKN